MLGFKSLEDKLRESGGARATATVLSAKAGIYTTMSSGGMYAEDITRWHYAVRVEPQGEEPFEAKIVIRINHMHGLSLSEGQKVTVLHDPDDHRKVAFDLTATEHQVQTAWQQHVIEYDPPDTPPPAPSEADSWTSSQSSPISSSAGR